MIESPGVYMHCSFMSASCFHVMRLQLAQSEVGTDVLIKHELVRTDFDSWT